MEKNTKLTKPEFTEKANAWIAANQDRWQQIRAATNYPYQYLGKILQSMYGKPVWRDRPGRNKTTGTMPTENDPGVLFLLEDAGSGKVKFKSLPTRKATRGGPTKSSSGTRQFTERITSPPGTDFADSQRRIGEANSRGMDGGHITPLERQRAGQVEAVKRGRTVQEYKSNFQRAGLSIGHTRENIEDQTPEDNRVRQRQDYSKLDNHLRALGIKYGNNSESKPNQKNNRGRLRTRRAAKPGAQNVTQSPQKGRGSLRILSNALGGGSGSAIVDRINARMHLIAPLTPDLQLF